MTKRPEPYVRRDPGDVIRSGDWNELQVQAREAMQGHRHSGGDDGLKVPREGIEAKAIDGSLIDPAANVTLNSLTVSKELKVNGKAILKEIVDFSTSLKNLESDKVSRAGDTIAGSLKLEDNLVVAGNIGLGTDAPKARLDVNGSIYATPVMGTWYPTGSDPNASKPGGQWIFIIFNGEEHVTDKISFSNLGSDLGIRIEVEGFYHIEVATLVYVSPGDYGHLRLYLDGSNIRTHHSYPADYTNWNDRYVSWKGLVNAGSIVQTAVYHQKQTPYWYHMGSHYTHLTIHKIN